MLSKTKLDTQKIPSDRPRAWTRLAISKTCQWEMKVKNCRMEEREIKSRKKRKKETLLQEEYWNLISICCEISCRPNFVALFRCLPFWPFVALRWRAEGAFLPNCMRSRGGPHNWLDGPLVLRAILPALLKYSYHQAVSVPGKSAIPSYSKLSSNSKTRSGCRERGDNTNTQRKPWNIDETLPWLRT